MYRSPPALVHAGSRLMLYVRRHKPRTRTEAARARSPCSCHRSPREARSMHSDTSELKIFRMSFDGKVLSRGFWLYVWRVRAPEKEYLYVGRTGDSSSSNAASPFNRIGAHLDIRPTAKGNALGRRLAEANVDPAACHFEMVAVGPLFPEQIDMKAHRPMRDCTSALEKALAQLLLSRGYCVLGAHRCRHELDQDRFETIRRLLDPLFPDLALGSLAGPAA
jgi:hypothetical protein